MEEEAEEQQEFSYRQVQRNRVPTQLGDGRTSIASGEEETPQTSASSCYGSAGFSQALRMRNRAVARVAGRRFPWQRGAGSRRKSGRKCGCPDAASWSSGAGTRCSLEFQFRGVLNLSQPYRTVSGGPHPALWESGELLRVDSQGCWEESVVSGVKSGPIDFKAGAEPIAPSLGPHLGGVGRCL